MGYSRDSFYRFQEVYDKGGEMELMELSRRRPNIRNRVVAEIEEGVVELALEQPAWCRALSRMPAPRPVSAATARQSDPW